MFGWIYRKIEIAAGNFGIFAFVGYMAAREAKAFIFRQPLFPYG